MIIVNHRKVLGLSNYNLHKHRYIKTTKCLVAICSYLSVFSFIVFFFLFFISILIFWGFLRPSQHFNIYPYLGSHFWNFSFLSLSCSLDFFFFFYPHRNIFSEFTVQHFSLRLLVVSPFSIFLILWPHYIQQYFPFNKTNYWCHFNHNILLLIVPSFPIFLPYLSWPSIRKI